jgi:hypothetical protein
MITSSGVDELGHHLWNYGFQPIPDVDDHGRLLGARLWRHHAGFVEFIAPRTTGVSFAGRTVADFSFRDPLQHGGLVAFRRGHPLNLLYWLLSDQPSTEPEKE